MTPLTQDEGIALAHYEGLVAKTALMLVGHVEVELEDIRQILWIKVVKALRAYNPAKARGLTRDRYVFMCLRDQAKDIEKRRKRHDLFIEDLVRDDDKPGLPSRDTFENRYLAADHEKVYGHVEPDHLHLPNTLSPTERDVVLRLFAGHKPTEVYVALGLGRKGLELAMQAIRTKLADWKPGDGSQQTEDRSGTLAG